MLLNFRFKNYKVFKEEQLFSMIAHKPFKEHLDTHLVSNDSLGILHSAVLYGANASGKSIFVEAMDLHDNLFSNHPKSLEQKILLKQNPFFFIPLRKGPLLNLSLHFCMKANATVMGLL